MSQDAAEHFGTNRQLFVDDYLIESMQGVNLKLHGATPAGNILTLEPRGRVVPATTTRCSRTAKCTGCTTAVRATKAM